MFFSFLFLSCFSKSEAASDFLLLVRGRVLSRVFYGFFRLCRRSHARTAIIVLLLEIQIGELMTELQLVAPFFVEVHHRGGHVFSSSPRCLSGLPFLCRVVGSPSPSHINKSIPVFQESQSGIGHRHIICANRIQRNMKPQVDGVFTTDGEEFYSSSSSSSSVNRK